MTTKTTILLGAGLLTAGLVFTGAARANADDQALAFIAGAAVGYVIGERDGDVHQVHYRGHPRHYRHDYRDWRKGWHHSKYKHHPRFYHHPKHRSYRHDKHRGYKYRDDRRHDRRHDRHDRRDGRRWHS
jgi:hypothetical protein